MKLHRVRGVDMWQPSEDEQSTRRAQRGGGAVATAPLAATEVSIDILVDATRSELHASLPSTEPAPTPMPHGGDDVQLPDDVTKSLAEQGYAFFSGSCVSIPAALDGVVTAFHEAYAHLAYQEFGRPGATGFFAGRRIGLGGSTLPGAVEDLSDARHALALHLARAVVAAIPATERARCYAVTWMLSRHDGAVRELPPHRDQCAYLALFLVGRSPGVKGGTARVVRRDGTTVAEVLLTTPWSGYILKDADWNHGASALWMDQPGVDRRDALILRIWGLDDEGFSKEGGNGGFS
jgi:hypothetical protein